MTHTSPDTPKQDGSRPRRPFPTATTRTSPDTPRQDGSHPRHPLPPNLTPTSHDTPREDGDSHPTHIRERAGAGRGASPPPVGSVDRERIDSRTLLAPPDRASLADP